MKPTAVVFPGQGAQRPGMAREFYDTYSESRAVFDRASQALSLDMAALCFEENEKLNQTEYTQPAILTAEIAILEALEKHFNLNPELFGGHSLGEYTALVAAGVMDLADAVQIVRKRGALMQRAVPSGVGAMAAILGDNLVALDYASIVKECGAEIANYNSPAQVVISGPAESVKNASDALAKRFPVLNIIALNVSAPFHCSLMREIEPEFAECLGSFKRRFALQHAGKVLSNFNGGFHNSDSMIDSLVRQISGSVLWVKNMEVLSAAAGEIYEIGPNRVLSKFFGGIGVTTKAVTDMRTLKRAFPAE